jgi:hypothetical protein
LDTGVVGYIRFHEEQSFAGLHHSSVSVDRRSGPCRAEERDLHLDQCGIEILGQMGRARCPQSRIGEGSKDPAL